MSGAHPRDGRSAVRTYLGARAALVAAASAWKRVNADVQAPARVAAVLANVRGAAARTSLDADDVETAYRALVAIYVRWEENVRTGVADLGGWTPPTMPLGEIRGHIDALDRRIIGALAGASHGALEEEPALPLDLAALSEVASISPTAAALVDRAASLLAALAPAT